MGSIKESGQLLVGAVFLLMAMVLFLFSVYDIAQLWRDRAKMQQAVDAAALSAGAVMCDFLGLMHVYNVLAKPFLPFFPAQTQAVGNALDKLRAFMERADFIASITGMLGSETFYLIVTTSTPDLGVHFRPEIAHFVFSETQNPGKRVFTVSGLTTTINRRYLLKRYTGEEWAPNVFICATATVGIFKQGRFGFTYVPVLLK